MDKKKVLWVYLLQRLVFFVTLLAVWWLSFPNTLLRIEENDFFVYGSDISFVQYPHIVDLASAWLAQFYGVVFRAALLQSVLPLLVLLSADAVVWNIFRRCEWLWVSFFPASLLLLVQSGAYTLAPSLRVVLASVAVGLLSFVLRLARRNRPEKQPLRPVLRWCALLSPFLCSLMLLATMLLSKPRRQYEETIQVEHWADEGQWSKILDITYPKRYRLSQVERAYSLLALARCERIADRLFTYPVSGAEDLFDPLENNPVNCRFCSYFCWNLNIINEAIRYSFQEGQGEAGGASFGSLRRMTDFMVQKGVYKDMARFNLNLLGHSSCHADYVKTRSFLLDHTPMKGIYRSTPVFMAANPVYVAALALDNNPADRVARDELLCSLLLLRQLEEFYEMLKVNFHDDENAHIPECYQQALVMLRARHPEIEAEYTLSPSVREHYADFLRLMRLGSGGQKKAYALYRETYWGYLLRTDKMAKEMTDDNGVSGNS